MRRSDPRIQATGIADMVTGRTLAAVTVLRFDRDGRFLERIDARRAQLDGGVWRLGQTIVRRPSAVANSRAEITLPSKLTPAHLSEGFRPPQAVSFWDLGDYAAALGAMGVPIHGHTLTRHRLLALPLLLAATALIAAAFSLRGPRRGGVAMIIGAGVLMGFLLYSLSDIAFALALSAKVPAPLAAWAPAVASMLLGTALLLHLEDG
jgi:lipopolysaccharide export system permease protein